ncbi:YqgE/AlgH family protein [Emticicia sp. BO119]|uniref:YqgE/AlgH family protein n=1 Tax=Emticicia sp. BO119 TaxID=2757768 RepID=UPI001E3DACCE|nr:YqgE/AlgH family protein [Emticicia sp. BO119]
MSVGKGKLLIAEPFLGDPNFERSVVLLCEHNSTGSFGLVLNQTTSLHLDDVIENVYGELPLFIGGPVEQNTLHFIHRLGNQIEGAVDIGNGIYWSGDFESVKTLINIGKVSENDIRLFIGYSGWSAGQLVDEMNRNSWIVSETDAHFIFDTPADQFWRAILKSMGGEYKVLSNYPTDPRLN